MSTETVRIDNVEPRTTSRRSKASLADTLRFPAIVWVIHVLVTQLVATLSFRFGSIRSVDGDGAGGIEPKNGQLSSAFQLVRPDLDGWQHWLVQPFRHWDGTWYSMIAEQGYSTDYTALSAFFPLYPWLMDLGSNITGLPVETIGFFISRLAFLGTLVMAYKLVQMDFNERIAQIAIAAVAIFPTAFFFGAVYTESLFFLLAVTTLWAARKNDWLLAVIVCLFATMTRSAGILLGAPLAVLFIQQHGWDLRRWFPKVLLGLLPPIGLVIFGWVLTRQGLGFLDWQEQQWQWNRFSATPWRTFQCAFQGCEDVTVRGFGGTYQTDVPAVSFAWLGDLWDHFSWSYLTSTEFRYWFGQSQWFDVIVTLLAFALIIVGLRKLPLYYSAWTIPPMIVPLLAPSSVFPLMSMPRFVLPLLPLFVMAALLIPNRKVMWTLAGISIVLLIIFTSQFSLWYWVA